MAHRSRYRARGRKIITLLLAVCLLAGCGKNGQGNPGGLLSSGQSGSKAEEPQGKYKAEPLETEDDTENWLSVRSAGEYVYYYLYSDDAETENRMSSMYRYTLSDGTTEPLPVVIRNGSIPFYDVGEGGDIYAYVVYREAPGTEGEESVGEGEDGEKEESEEREGEEEGAREFRLEKYDAKGSRIYSTKIEEPPTDTRFFRMAADGNGRVYLYYNGQMSCFDEQGKLTGNISSLGGPESTLSAMCRGGDGAVYACVTRDASHSSLVRIDYAKRTANIVMEDFVSCAGGGLCPGWEENTLLAQNGGMVYEYDLIDKSRKALLRWTDSGLDGNQILSLGAVPEGKILAAMIGTINRKGGVFALRKLSEEEAPQREEIVLATTAITSGTGIYRLSDNLLSEAVLAFNNSNDKYYVTIKEYGENVIEASQKLDLDMVSGKGPDILYDNLLYRATSLAKQGVLEDLEPWLEQSTVIGREDFVDHTLDGCIYDGKLAILPQSFELFILIGRASDVGEDVGWTMEELMALPEKHPEAQLFSGWSNKYYMFRRCMKLYMDRFVDWDAGKCSFDSPEFIRLLEFANRYGDMEENAGELSDPVKLHLGKTLLSEKYPMKLEDRQYYDWLFGGEACTVGYPTTDGGPANFIQPGKKCGITTFSEHKEAHGRSWRAL